MSDPGRRLAALLRRLHAEHEPAPLPQHRPDDDPILEEILFGLLLWESATPLAVAARQRLRDAFADWNDVRVAAADDVAAELGADDPLADERALRLRSVLNDIYQRRHGLTLAWLAERPADEQRAFIEPLEGLPRPASARALLLLGGGRLVPVDERVRDLVARAGAVAAQTSAEQLAAALSKGRDTPGLLGLHRVLQAWSDQNGVPPRRDARDSDAGFDPGPGHAAPPTLPAPAPKAPKPAKPKRAAAKAATPSPRTPSRPRTRSGS